MSPQMCKKNCMNTMCTCSFFFFLYKIFLFFITFSFFYNPMHGGFVMYPLRIVSFC